MWTQKYRRVLQEYIQMDKNIICRRRSGGWWVVEGKPETTEPNHGSLKVTLHDVRLTSIDWSDFDCLNICRCPLHVWSNRLGALASQL